MIFGGYRHPRPDVVGPPPPPALSSASCFACLHHRLLLSARAGPVHGMTRSGIVPSFRSLRRLGTSSLTARNGAVASIFSGTLSQSEGLSLIAVFAKVEPSPRRCRAPRPS
jgi:hypothetical protein